MRDAGVQRQELISIVRNAGLSISRQAVGKWFNGRTKTMETQYAVPIAARLRVNTIWLSNGDGHRELGYIPPPTSPLVDAFQRLPASVSEPLQALILALARILPGT